MLRKKNKDALRNADWLNPSFFVDIKLTLNIYVDST